jgi:hypothetical protein
MLSVLIADPAFMRWQGVVQRIRYFQTISWVLIVVLSMSGSSSPFMDFKRRLLIQYFNRAVVLGIGSRCVILVMETLPGPHGYSRRFSIRQPRRF